MVTPQSDRQKEQGISLSGEKVQSKDIKNCHERIRVKGNFYQCSYCNKSFSQKKNQEAAWNDAHRRQTLPMYLL